MDEKDVGLAPEDITGWHQVIEDQILSKIPGHRLVAAVQKIGPFGDRRVLNPLMSEISDRIMRILRNHIGRNHRNEGMDMIEEAHGKLIEAVLQPNSADGTAMRTAFVETVKFRGADAIARERRHSDRYSYSEDETASRVNSNSHRALSPDEECAYIENLLKRIADPRKRLAFRLHMEGVPRGSTKVDSIASAVGVSTKTAEDWVKEIKKQLESILGDEP